MDRLHYLSKSLHQLRAFDHASEETVVGPMAHAMLLKKVRRHGQVLQIELHSQCRIPRRQVDIPHAFQPTGLSCCRRPEQLKQDIPDLF